MSLQFDLTFRTHHGSARCKVAIPTSVVFLTMVLVLPDLAFTPSSAELQQAKSKPVSISKRHR